MLKAYLQRGVNVLCFDYRGVGMSRGTFSEEGSYRDTKVALQYLLSKKVPMNKIAIEGYSMGSGPATQIASESKGTHLLLRCPLAKTSDVGVYKLQQRGLIRPLRWVARWIMDYIQRYDNLAKIAKVAGTVGLIIARYDQRVEEPHCHHGERLAQAYLKRSGDKSLLYSEAAQHHESSYKENDMAAALDAFLQRIGFLKGRSQPFSG
jgi:pimeloyl-ACP methyl ester carboxylesterase